ncbi:MAG: TrkA C-terminal domain-containing protein, partial [Anaerolineales bacterium]
PALERATLISMMARNPDALALLTTASDDRDSQEVLVRNPEVVGKQLRELQLPGDLLILAVRRDEQLLIARGGTAFEIGDRVSILGDPEGIRIARELFGG